MLTKAVCEIYIFCCFWLQDPNDQIRTEQLRELALLNGLRNVTQNIPGFGAGPRPIPPMGPPMMRGPVPGQPPMHAPPPSGMASSGYGPGLGARGPAPANGQAGPSLQYQQVGGGGVIWLFVVLLVVESSAFGKVVVTLFSCLLWPAIFIWQRLCGLISWNGPVGSTLLCSFLVCLWLIAFPQFMPPSMANAHCFSMLKIHLAVCWFKSGVFTLVNVVCFWFLLQVLWQRRWSLVISIIDWRYLIFASLAINHLLYHVKMSLCSAVVFSFFG